MQGEEDFLYQWSRGGAEGDKMEGRWGCKEMREEAIARKLFE